MSNETTNPTSATRADSPALTGYAAGEGYDDEGCQEWDEPCGQCGGDGWIMLSDAGPSEWGEDSFSELDRPIECPECREQRQHEARERAKAKRHTDQAHLSAPGGRVERKQEKQT